MTGLNTGEHVQDEPDIILQQNEHAHEHVDVDDEDVVTGPTVLAHTKLAKTGGKWLLVVCFLVLTLHFRKTDLP